jgi:hypothetical protein
VKPLPSVVLDTQQRSRLRYLVAVTATFLCRVLPGTRQTSLPSAREKVLGKEAFTDVLFAEPSLPSATLGKAFAECFWGLAECFGHSAKRPFPVVAILSAITHASRSSSKIHTTIVWCDGGLQQYKMHGKNAAHIRISTSVHTTHQFAVAAKRQVVAKRRYSLRFVLVVAG